MFRFSSAARLYALAALILAAHAAAQAQTSPATLIPAGETWRFNDTGTDLGTVWRAPAYDDSAWPSGRAQLGYGDGDETTVLSYGPDPNHKRPCYCFRRTFSVAAPSAFASLTLRIVRDDGCAVYINGQEVLRSNMPAGAISYSTWASTALGDPPENAWNEFAVSPSVLVPGTNVIAVEVHQANATSTDVSFDLALLGSGVEMVKGPYLQRVTPTSIVVMWETNAPAPSRVDFGKAAPNESSVQDLASVTLHEAALGGLTAGTAYQYVASSGPASSAAATFTTAPPAGQGFHFAAYGDSRGESGDYSLHATHLAVMGALVPSQPAIVLHTGDLVYTGGDLGLWWPQFFGPAADLMKNVALFPALGNHEYNSDATAANYRAYFSLPSAAERWYSFDYGCAHFICLDTNIAADYSPGSAQYDWLVDDLTASRSAPWRFVFFHHPPYTRTTSHTDDLNVQKHLVPLFEQFGVDVVFNGHSHAYERYFRNGVSYIVTGGGGASLAALAADTTAPIRQAGASVNHYCFITASPGAFLLEARDTMGLAFDTLGLTRDATPPTITNVAAGAIGRTSATITWNTDELADSLVAYGPTAAYGKQAAVPTFTVSHSVSLAGLTPGATYHYLVTSKDAAGNSASGADATFQTANHPPVAAADSASTRPSAPVKIKVLANDSDPDGDRLTVTAVTQGANGVVARNANSTVAYTPQIGFVGADSFTYTIGDGYGGTASAAVAVTVGTPANLYGWITQPDGTGLRGIRVRLEKMNSSSQWSGVSSTTTNAAGYYEFRRVKPSTVLYRVRPSSSSWTFTPADIPAAVVSSVYQQICNFTATSP